MGDPWSLGLVFQFYYRSSLLPAGLRSCFCSSGYSPCYNIDGFNNVCMIFVLGRIILPLVSIGLIPPTVISIAGMTISVVVQILPQLPLKLPLPQLLCILPIDSSVPPLTLGAFWKSFNGSFSPGLYLKGFIVIDSISLIFELGNPAKFFIDCPFPETQAVLSSSSNFILRIGRHGHRCAAHFDYDASSYAMDLEGDFNAANGGKHLNKGFRNFSARSSTPCATSHRALLPPPKNSR
ncbi:uncharacterized protein G2W53_039560 [Senna tora]|uniref:Uncharacterized protein n=1 Tax=Senna tora TaxID=362788 RepID=A0A834SNT8_9FABA|nr:uncharacterized protein G2W53_039560 [Senna tora]